MPKVFPEVIKPSFEQPPLGTIVWQIMEAYENMIGRDSPKYGISVELEGIEPPEAVGVAHTENFIFGVLDDRTLPDDPGDLENGVSEETFTARGGRFDTFCQKVDVDIRGGDLLAICQEIKDRSVKSRNEGQKQPAIISWGANRGQPNPNFGRYNVRLRWLHISEGGVPEVTGTVADLEAAESPAVTAQATASVPAPPPQRRVAATAPVQATPAPAVVVQPQVTPAAPAAPMAQRPSPIRKPAAAARPAAPQRR